MSLAASYAPIVKPVSSVDVFAQLSPESQRFLLALMHEFLSVEQLDSCPSPQSGARPLEDRRLPRQAGRMASCQLELVYSRAHQQSG